MHSWWSDLTLLAMCSKRGMQEYVSPSSRTLFYLAHPLIKAGRCSALSTVELILHSFVSFLSKMLYRTNFAVPIVVL